MHSMEGYLRPGCVHLTVQALLTSYAATQQQRRQQQEQQAEEQRPSSCGGAAGADGLGGSQPAPAAAAAACCANGRPALPAALPCSAVRRVVDRMLSSGEASLLVAHCCSSRCDDLHWRLHSACPPQAADGPLLMPWPPPLLPLLSSPAGEALWRSKTMLVQAGTHVALVHGGRLRQVRALPRRAVQRLPSLRCGGGGWPSAVIACTLL